MWTTGETLTDPDGAARSEHAGYMAGPRMTVADQNPDHLLRRWMTPQLDLPGGFRFHDAPPDVVRLASGAIDGAWSTVRFNGQPPAEWLVNTAERLGGLLSGLVGNDEELPTRLRVDAICVAGERAGELAQAVHDDWPQPVFDSVALDLALAEGWDSWAAEQPIWTGNGRELLDAHPGAAVIGLWWD